MAFLLLLLDTPQDFALVKPDSCKRCTEMKLGAKILRSFRISKQEFKECRRDDVKGFNVKCEETCTQFELIQDNLLKQSKQSKQRDLFD